MATKFKFVPPPVKCHQCTALYQPGDWWVVSRPDDTSDRVNWLRPIDPDHCPICLKPPQIEPSPQAGVM